MDTLSKINKNGIFFNHEDLSKICEKYMINQLSVFGSVLRDDFSDDSDIDLLVSFLPESRLTLYDIFDLKEDFSKLLKRDVDLVEKEGLSNPIRKKIILNSSEVVYGNK